MNMSEKLKEKIGDLMEMFIVLSLNFTLLIGLPIFLLVAIGYIIQLMILKMSC